MTLKIGKVKIKPKLKFIGKVIILDKYISTDHNIVKAKHSIN